MVVQAVASVKPEQRPLFHLVDEDERILAADPDAEWYRLLQHVPWREYRALAALYYEALARFNEEAETRREERREAAGEPVSKWAASLLFCFERPTMGNESPPLLTESGLWEQAQQAEGRRNLETATIHPERTLVHDTTHSPAYSSFQTVVWIEENGKEHRKSQSKVTKSCTCADKQSCAHDWELCDDGAGTVVKSSGRMYWAHKASVLALPEQGVPLDAVAMTDAASYDSQSVLAHLERLQTQQREFLEAAEFLLDDRAADDPALRAQVFEDFDVTLRTPLNPRSRKPQTEDLPRGMAKLTPYGELVCQAELSLDSLGVRWEDNVFLYGPPKAEDNSIACLTCPHKQTCCPRAKHGRRVTLPFDALPPLDAYDPPLAKRFRAMMTHRPAVERVIKRLKCDFSDPHLAKRGNAAFQARLNQTRIAFHLLLRT